jgi:ribosomal protein S18 acetylase RimI-like enzyme
MVRVGLTCVRILETNMIMSMASDDFSIANLVRATEENFWTLWQRFGLTPGGALHQKDSALWFDTTLPFLPYNGVIRFQPSSDKEFLIDEITAHYAERKVPHFWVVHPTCSPANLAELLELRGMVLVEQIPGMTMDLAELPPIGPIPNGVEILEATTLEEIGFLQELIAWRWDVPENCRQAHREMTLSFGVGTPGSRLRCGVALINGEPVSKVLLNLDAGSAGIHGVVTKPEARGRGIARALTLTALHAARVSGYRLGMLHSSPMARSMYEKIGFRHVSDFRVYAAGGNFHV